MLKKMRVWLMLVCAFIMAATVASNVSFKSDAATTVEYIVNGELSSDESWKIWVQKSDNKCIIKPVTTSTITGVNSGAVVIPTKVTVKKTKKSYTVNTIGNSAYKGNTKITSVNFKNATGLVSIRENAFSGCTGLKRIYNLNYATGLTTISAGAFQGDTALTSENTGGLALPAGLKTIGANAFNGCKNIKCINSVRTKNLTSIGTDAFKDVSSKCVTYVDSTTRKTLYTGKVPGTVIVYYYKVIYNSNDGQKDTYTENLTYQTNSDNYSWSFIHDASIFSRKGYTFQSWNTKADGTGTTYKPDQEVANLTKTGTFNLYAIWKKNTYKVHFVKNEPKKFDTLESITVSGTMADTSCTYDVSKAIPANSYKCTGFVFDGWYKNADCTGSAVTSLYNLTPVNGGTANLYAKWTPVNYQVTFDPNGSGDRPVIYNLSYNYSFSLPKDIFAKRGYNFKGWSDTQTGSVKYKNGQSVSNLCNTNGGVVTLYAVWEPISYTVTFVKPVLMENRDENIQAAVSGEVDNVSATYDVRTELPAGYTCKGYTFKGWKTEAGYKVESIYNLTDSDYEIVKLYADMSPVEYSVRLDKNGGELKDGAAEYEPVQMLYSYSYAIDGDRYQRTGYVLSGWSTEKDGAVQYKTTDKVVNLRDTEGEVTLYAKWQPITYTVVFDSNVEDPDSVEGYKDPVKFTYDVAKKLGNCGFEHKGYVFTGWNTERNGSGTAYTNNQVVTNLSTEDKAVITLYAQWRPIKYTVVFDLGIGGEGTAPDSIECTFGESFNMPEEDTDKMTKPGYRLDGWCTNMNGIEDEDTDKIFDPGQECSEPLTYNDGEEVTLYAQWKSEKFKLRYVTGTEEVIADSRVTSTNSKTGVLTPEAEESYKSGYEFAGWNTKEDGTGIAIGDSFRPLNNTAALRGGTVDEGDSYTIIVTLYAQWTPKTYEVNITLSCPGYKTGSLATNTPLKYTVKYGQKFVSKLPSPTLEGHDFQGWATSDNKKITSDTVYDYTDDIEVHPTWKIRTFKVTYNCNGAKLNGKDKLEKNYNWNTKFKNTAPKLSKKQITANKKFIGWYYNKKVNNKWKKVYLTANTIIKSDLTVYADIYRPTYTVKLNLGYKNKNNKTVVKELKYKYLETLGSNSKLAGYEKRAGYIFDGWYYKKNNKTYKAERTSQIKGGITLTARWKKPSVVRNATKVDRKNQKMVVSWAYDSRYTSFQYRIASSVNKLTKAAVNEPKLKSGAKVPNKLTVPLKYKFCVIQVRAKYKDSTGKYCWTAWTTFYDVGCDRAYVTFNPSGGTIGKSGNVRKVTFIKSKPLITSSNFLTGKLYTPTKKGYTFNGWYYKKGGKWTKVTINTTLAPNTNVYAKWKKKK